MLSITFSIFLVSILSVIGMYNPFRGFSFGHKHASTSSQETLCDIAYVNFDQKQGEYCLKNIQQYVKAAKDRVSLTESKHTLESPKIGSKLTFFCLDSVSWNLLDKERLHRFLETYFQIYIKICNASNCEGEEPGIVFVAFSPTIKTPLQAFVLDAWSSLNLLNNAKIPKVVYVLDGRTLATDFSNSLETIIQQNFGPARLNSTQKNSVSFSLPIAPSKLVQPGASQVIDIGLVEEVNDASSRFISLVLENGQSLEKPWMMRFASLNTSRYCNECRKNVREALLQVSNNHRQLFSRKLELESLVGASYRARSWLIYQYLQPMFHSMLHMLTAALQEEAKHALRQFLMSAERAQINVDVESEIQHIKKRLMEEFEIQVNILSTEFTNIADMRLAMINGKLEDDTNIGLSDEDTVVLTLFSNSLTNKYNKKHNLVPFQPLFSTAATTATMKKAEVELNQWMASSKDKLIVDGVINPFLRRYSFPPIKINLSYLLDLRKDLFTSPTEKLFDRHLNGYVTNRADPIFISEVAKLRFDPNDLPIPKSTQPMWRRAWRYLSE